MKFFALILTVGVLSGCASLSASHEMQACTNMCEAGAVAKYKWCKCITKAIWDSED